VTTWQASRPADAAEIQKIANQPWAKWISGGTTAIPQGDIDWINARYGEGKVPLIVAYSIPSRDTGGLASGGQSGASAYKSWIDSLAAAIGNRRAIVVLEPDALPQISNLSTTDQSTRYALINYAVNALKAKSGIAVYLDAGNPLWVSTTDMAPRLGQAGIAKADGFSLNVSNFCTTSSCISYGDALSSLVGGKHYIVDTSRNGLGPTSDGQWCNPSGRALGPKPLSPTGDTLCDAFVWVKAPGYSDGGCNGGPSWGWWADYALGLAQRASW
jgi:endoglucanase